ncbi:MAG: hypothetical protein ABFC34_00330 [Methanobacterium sp.]
MKIEYDYKIKCDNCGKYFPVDNDKVKLFFGGNVSSGGGSRGPSFKGDKLPSGVVLMCTLCRTKGTYVSSDLRKE